jgi:hypothetical protein
MAGGQPENGSKDRHQSVLLKGGSLVFSSEFALSGQPLWTLLPRRRNRCAASRRDFRAVAVSHSETAPLAVKPPSRKCVRVPTKLSRPVRPSRIGSRSIDTCTDLPQTLSSKQPVLRPHPRLRKVKYSKRLAVFFVPGTQVLGCVQLRCEWAGVQYCYEPKARRKLGSPLGRLLNEIPKGQKLQHATHLAGVRVLRPNLQPGCTNQRPPSGPYLDLDLTHQAGCDREGPGPYEE